MSLYWVRVIGPKSGVVLFQEYFYSLDICREEVRQWLTEGMTVETWSNYRQGY